MMNFVINMTNFVLTNDEMCVLNTGLGVKTRSSATAERPQLVALELVEPSSPAAAKAGEIQGQIESLLGAADPCEQELDAGD